MRTSHEGLCRKIKIKKKKRIEEQKGENNCLEGFFKGNKKAKNEEIREKIWENNIFTPQQIEGICWMTNS